MSKTYNTQFLRLLETRWSIRNRFFLKLFSVLTLLYLLTYFLRFLFSFQFSLLFIFTHVRAHAYYVLPSLSWTQASSADLSLSLPLCLTLIKERHALYLVLPNGQVWRVSVDCPLGSGV